METDGTATIRDLLVKKEALGVKLIRPLLPKLIEGRDKHFALEAMKNVAYTAAHLYMLDHPDNPYRNDPAILAMSLSLADAWCDQHERNLSAGKKMTTTEWPPYIMSQIIEMLPPETLGDDRRRRWTEILRQWCDQMSPKPFFFTSPNHEAWKCMAMYAIGSVLGRTDYMSAALFQQRQELTYQTPEGFWEEGRHHGPSMKYNFMQLQAMARLAQMSGDEDIRASVVRLADFMAEFHFPDGSTMGCLDGRQSYTLGPWLVVTPGQDLTPAIREIARRSVATQDRYGCFRDPRYFSSSYWYATYGMVMLTDASRFFNEVREAPVALPLDAEGGIVERHSPYMDGGAIRRGGFVAALSGIISDIPKEGGDRFRLQRQNRIDLWHVKTGLLIGGGHGVGNQNPPYANVVMDTGAFGKTNFGQLHQQRWDEQLSYISPRAAATSFAGASASLDVHFAHGSVSFGISVLSADEAEIHYEYRTHGVERLNIQILPVLFRDSLLRIDEQSVDPVATATHPVESSVEVTNTILGGTYRIEHEAGRGLMSLRCPLDPLRTYGKLHENEPFDSVYKQSLLSVQIDDPPAEGSGRFRVTVR